MIVHLFIDMMDLSDNNRVHTRICKPIFNRITLTRTTFPFMHEAALKVFVVNSYFKP